MPLRTTATLLSAHRFSKYTRAQYVTWLLTSSDKISEHGRVSVLLRSLLLYLSFLLVQQYPLLCTADLFCKSFPLELMNGFPFWLAVRTSNSRDVLQGTGASVLGPPDKGAGTDAHQLMCRHPGKQVLVLFPFCW